MEKDNGIDKLFKDGLHDPEIPFNELDWAKMEQKLDAQGKKRAIPFWLFATSGIAAALIVGLFWYFSGADKIVKAPKKVEIADAKQQKPVNNNPVVIGTDTVSVVKTTPNIDKNYVKAPRVVNPNQYLTDVPTVIPSKENDKQEFIAQLEDKKISIEAPGASTDSLVVNQKLSNLVMENTVIRDWVPTRTTGALTLSIMAAPDISNAKLNVDTKISSNIGILATYAITNKISVTTGAIYSRKLYNYGGVGSAGTAYLKNAWQVDADCIVLDVPLNVNYTFLKRRNYTIGVNSGLSSYFMLNEKYKYITGPQGGTQKVSELEIRNQNQHIFGVANLSLSFERKITNSLSLGVQPFVKLPLTGIGNGNARLKSTGVAFSINLGLFPKRGGGY